MIMRLFCILLVLTIWGCKHNEVITANNSYTPKDFTVKGTIRKILGDKVYLYNFYGHKTNRIDSAKVEPGGKFTFKLKKELPVGLYRIILGKSLKSQFTGGGEQYVDFIFKYEDISFQTNFDFPYDSMKVNTSEENRLYYEYQSKSDENKSKLDVLLYCLQYYPRTDDFYKDFSKQYKRVYDEYDNYVSKLIRKNEGSLLAKIAAFEKIPYVDPLLSKNQRNEILKTEYFGKNDFTDTLLLHTDLIPSKVINYLSFYRVENLPQEAQEAEFNKAIDVIMKKVGSNEQIYNNVLDYLIDGFEKFEMEMTLLHIYDNYVQGSSCMEEGRAKSLKEKTDAIKRLGKGQQAPDFTIVDLNNKTVKLQDVSSKYTLVLFWASWCTHCAKVIPEIKKLYDETDRAKLEIIAISLDTNKVAWNNYLTQNKLNWINYSDLKGWDSPIGRSYYVSATPTMFLLDKDKKIVAKPLNVKDLRMNLN